MKRKHLGSKLLKTTMINVEIRKCNIENKSYYDRTDSKMLIQNK